MLVPPATASLGDLLAQCAKAPALSRLPFHTVSSLISLLCHMKERISFTQKAAWTNAPQHLPRDVHEFIKRALDLDDKEVTLCWNHFKDLAWEPECHWMTANLAALIPLYLEHGEALKIGE